MRITFVNDVGQTFGVEIDPQMELENIMALLEVDSGIPAAEQSISLDGVPLDDPSKPIASYGVVDGAILLLRKKVTVAGRTAAQDSEMMRLQVLGNPQLMRELRETHPELADAAVNNPELFAELLRQTAARTNEAEAAKKREVEALNADPFDVEAQRRIEEAIRQQAVLENMEHAIEHAPEAFGRVIMLYIPVEVNGISVKAFVDSGAQQTIISPGCAEKCGIMRLLDKRFSGIAKGVGTAPILGRVHSAQLKLGDLHLPCSFTVMEGRDVDLLFGLDMLKAHQACIDLEKNVLRIRGREVPFLPEHQLPNFGDVQPDELRDTPSAPGTAASGSSTAPPSRFPGSGSTLGAAPRTTRTQQQPQPTQTFPERDIETLMSLGASRELALSTLAAAQGNVDVAASLLF